MEEELKILLLEDLEEDAGLIERALRKDNVKFISKRVDARDEFIESLQSFRPDIILSDHALPQFNSIEALKICQDMDINAPFILVTGAVSEEFAVMCMKRGVADYVLKSNLTRLSVAIKTSLDYRLQELTSLQQQSTLQKQNKELIKINNELDSFVYSVSHNLRSPLSSILGLINLAKLEEPKKPEVLDGYFTLIKKSVLKLDETIREILDYSKNSRVEPIGSSINIEQHVVELIDQLKFMHGENIIDTQVEISTEEEFISDSYRFKVILINVLSNAIKYRDMTKGSQVIRVKGHVSRVKIVLEIYDNGMGIKPELLPNVFNMFYRATELSEGSGLGLYIVKEMVEKLKGTISITSDLYNETRVLLTIPNMK